MNSNDHRDLDVRLRAAAEPVGRGRVHHPSAQDLLDRIVRSPRTGGAPVTAPRRAVRHTGRWAVAGLAAAAVSAAVLVIPGLSGDQAAYASWTGTPAALGAGDTQALSRDCMTQKLTPDWGYTQAQLDHARKVLGEARGAYRYVAIATQQWTATCFRDKAGTVYWGSSFESPVSDGQLGAKGVELQAWGQLKTDEGYARLMSGHLGTDVTGVAVTTPDGRKVEATVDDHYFLAWYPEKAGETRPTTITLRLRDGSAVPNLSASDLYDAPKLN
ncbi:hypothetical protein ACWT_6833 [Actinoplanes sp. SE50]|uniref:hypothetical protein n=1 Tax=unclassified Actinoplanes TaxID=2626549 RepID=UPI00023ED324|nr:MULTISPECIES: hypothetical protein [unclassified Actinoplanes]AEV87846.1 hypothetical protein ACPL_6964 [Actinoplanes sp. SE50/110]ATO86248.1 hypothetical protein ACWT_6833 [Actinoplanes sp. SE50]SLM03663.1 hypothetical protein ACSP50_6959 [Actinoplanes sp. SE50/110]